MYLDPYSYETNANHLDYEFYSDGPNGKIKKVIRYAAQNASGVIYFNLILGDWDQERNKIDDLAISNNLDREKFWLQLRRHFWSLFDISQTHLYT